MWPFVVIAVILVVLVAAFVIADAVAKSYAQNRIRSELVSALGIPASTPVTVDVGNGSVLLQALSGHLDTVDVSFPKLAFGDLVGAATVHATRVPLDRSQPLAQLAITYTVGEKDVAALAKNLSGLPLDSVTLKQPEIIANATVKVLVASVPVAVGFKPSVSNGRLVFTPTSVSAAGQNFTVDQLTSNPLLGGLAKTLLEQQSFCVAQYLPKALTATSAKVVGSSMVVAFEGDGATLGGSDFAAKGSCS